jgi:glycosyltransferase involved in cell wall biosynthesis
MKIAFTTVFDSKDVQNWSGTPFYMSNAFEQVADVEYISNLKNKTPLAYKFKKSLKRIFTGKRESLRFNFKVAENYSKQVAKRLANSDCDAIISPLINPITHLDSPKPIVLWTDALNASLLGFYPSSDSITSRFIEDANALTRECIARSRLLIFSSDWAAQSAIATFGINNHKVKVVPFGANINESPHQDEITKNISKKNRDTVKLLFLGIDWYRKGGDIVFAVANELHASGQKVELNFVGCLPPADVEIPEYIKCHGFISKAQPEGYKLLQTLLRESHFLFLPSRAEAYGIAFCEASAYGLPSLTSFVGGIPTVVKDNINGMKFALDSPVANYCDYIINLMQNYNEYEKLALSSFNEFQTRLNWNVNVIKVKKLLEDIL